MNVRWWRRPKMLSKFKCYLSRTCQYICLVSLSAFARRYRPAGGCYRFLWLWAQATLWSRVRIPEKFASGAFSWTRSHLFCAYTLQESGGHVYILARFRETPSSYVTSHVHSQVGGCQYICLVSLSAFAHRVNRPVGGRYRFLLSVRMTSAPGKPACST
jgi:hypothetical protein